MGLLLGERVVSCFSEQISTTLPAISDLCSIKRGVGKSVDVHCHIYLLLDSSRSDRMYHFGHSRQDKQMLHLATFAHVLPDTISNELHKQARVPGMVRCRKHADANFTSQILEILRPHGAPTKQLARCDKMFFVRCLIGSLPFCTSSTSSALSQTWDKFPKLFVS